MSNKSEINSAWAAQGLAALISGGVLGLNIGLALVVNDGAWEVVNWTIAGLMLGNLFFGLSK